MSESINGQIGEDGQMPLLVIAEESDEIAPALIVMEATELVAPLPAPAVPGHRLGTGKRSRCSELKSR